MFHFNFNLAKGKSSWSKPALLKKVSFSDLEKAIQIKVKVPQSPEEAATMIQGLFRKRVARKYILKMCSAIYEKVFDEESQKFFYYNKKYKE